MYTCNKCFMLYIFWAGTWPRAQNGGRPEFDSNPILQFGRIRESGATKSFQTTYLNNLHVFFRGHGTLHLIVILQCRCVHRMYNTEQKCSSLSNMNILLILNVVVCMKNCLAF